MKKCKYLMMSLLFVGASTVFTGCIDTDEPAGITELRGAKAELIKAQASLKLAEVSDKEADTALKLVKIEGEKLVNQLKELDVQLKQLQVDLETAKNEKEKADLQKQIDKINQDREEAAEKHKATMLAAQKATAEAQLAYDNALKAIEVAKMFVSDEEMRILNDKINALGDARTALNSAITALERANGDYIAALKGEVGANLERDLNRKLAKAEATVMAQELKVKELTDLIAGASPTADWDARVAELEEEVSDLEVEKAAAEIKKRELEIENAPVLATVEDLEDEADAANVAKIKIDDFETAEITNSYVASVLGRDKYTYTGGEFTNEEYLQESGVAVSIIDQIEAWIEELNERGIVTPEAEAQAVIERSQRVAARTAAVNAHTPNVTAWNTALTAYKANPDNYGDTNYTALMTASQDAFGTGANEPGKDFRLVAPTDDEVIALVENGGWNYTDFGTLGRRIVADQSVQEIDQLIAATVDFKDLVETLEDQLAIVTKIAEDNKKAVEAAEETAEKAREDYEALFDEVNDIIDANDIMIGAYTNPTDGLITVIKSKIELFLKDSNGNAYDNYADFIEALENLLSAAEDQLVVVQGLYDVADQNLALYEAGEYTEQYAINAAKEILDNAQQDYDIKKALYDNAYAQLKNAIDILLK